MMTIMFIVNGREFVINHFGLMNFGKFFTQKAKTLNGTQIITNKSTQKKNA